MFQTSAAHIDLPVYAEGDLAELEAYINGLPTWVPPAKAEPQAPGIGHNSAADPLAGWTQWKIFQRCIWVSDEDSNTKIMLLCVSRFMDKDLRASSMSYGQIARDCGFSEPTAKRCAKAVAGTWLTIGICKGRYVAGKGHENLYNGRIPQKWADELRRRILGGIAVTPDEAIIEAVDSAMEGASGVSHRYPEGRGVSGRHPENGISGYQGDTGVSGTLDRGITQTPVHLNTQKEKEGVLGESLQADADLRGEGDAARKRRGPTQAEVDAAFNEWWAHYPRKTAKLAAKKAYVAIVTGKHRDREAHATAQQLLAAVQAYKFPRDENFIKYPATWLNDGSWHDVGAATCGAGSVEIQIDAVLKGPRGREIITREGGEAAARSYLRAALSVSSVST